MSRRQRKVQKLVDSIIGGDMLVAGYDFDKDDLVVGKRQVTARGDFLDLGTVVMNFSFNKKVNIKSVSSSIDYSSIDARLVQNWKFSNYKKFERAAFGNYEDIYAKANSLSLQGVDYFQEAVDLYETIPGVKDLFVTFSQAAYGGRSWS